MTAARAVFFRRGISGARIEDITRRCHLSKGAFYLHFRSKTALFGELVAELTVKLDEQIQARTRAIEAYVRKHGRIGPRDIRARSARYAGLLELETHFDRQVLELLWEYRDVFSVLVRGAQGTPFSNWLWLMVDRELLRTQQTFDALRSTGACRDDVPREVLSSLVVGTYLLIANQMARMKTQPRFDVWVEAIARVIREGIAPDAAMSRTRLRSVS